MKPKKGPPPVASELRPAGFFVLRVPLLPFDSPWAGRFDSQGELGQDRTSVRACLGELVRRPEVREALFLASPSLEQDLDHWRSDPDSARGRRIEAALYRYFLRMSARPTPFGLFATCSTGEIDDTSLLSLGSVSDTSRHSRLDGGLVTALCEEVLKRPDVRREVRWRPNTSLCRLGGRCRYAEGTTEDGERHYQLVAIEPSAHLEAALMAAEGGATPPEVARTVALARPEATLEEAESFVEELLSAQVLVPELALPITGAEPVATLLRDLDGVAAARGTLEPLARAQARLASFDQRGPGVEPGAYRALATSLTELGMPVDPQHLVQVDLHRSAPELRLARGTVEELAHAISVLHRISPGHSALDELARFREDFLERYGSRAVRLVEVLDAELGIGFGLPPDEASEPAPLLEGLAPAEKRATPRVPWGKREATLLGLLVDALAEGRHEVSLGEADLDALASPSRLPLPDAFAAFGTLLAASAAEIDAGEQRIWFRGAAGPPGSMLLGRFCHGDRRLRAHVEAHLRAEESLHPEAVFAEIVHLPQGRIANVVIRPVLRGYEIPYLGRSGAPAERQLPVDDLWVAVVGGRVVLRSARLGREVLPRLSTAHHHRHSKLPVYRFLCALQEQGVVGSLGWSWGPLVDSPFLPRVTVGRTILAPAQWTLGAAEVRRLVEAPPAERLDVARALRCARRLPRWVAVGDADQLLPVDLENPLAVDLMVGEIRRAPSVTLLEWLATVDQLCVTSDEGRHVSEVVVPFVRAAPDPRPAVPFPPIARCTRSFPPGSEWLSLKLYTGTATIDDVLLQLAPALARLEASGAVDRWFFVRYGDPDWHLRLRLHGAPARLGAEVRPLVEAAAATMLTDGRVWKVQVDTYEREVERYGGDRRMALGEALFHADSKAALALVVAAQQCDGERARWRITLLGLHWLLRDLGFDLRARHAIFGAARGGFSAELADSAFLRRLGARFRQERAGLERLLVDPVGGGEVPEAAVRALEARSSELAPIATELRACEGLDAMPTSLSEIALSHLHMHANRMLRAAALRQELVLYDFLHRLHESELVRGG